MEANFVILSFTEKLERKIAIIIVILTFQYVASYYIEEGVLPYFLLFLFYLVPCFLLYTLVRNVRISLSIYESLMLLLYYVMLVLTVFNGGSNLGREIGCFMIYLPIVSSLFLSRINTKFLSISFKYLSIIALLVLPYVLSLQDLSIEGAAKRGYARTDMFSYASLFWAVIPTVILSFLYNKNILISLAYWSGAVVLNLFFLKRFILIDSLLILFSLLFINSGKGRRINTFILLFGFSILISLVLYYRGDLILGLFDATLSRIEDDTTDVSGFNRFVESRRYLESASWSQIVFGQGFAGTHFGLGTEHYALHVGWINFVLKGGFIFLFLIVIPFFKLIPISFKLKRYPLKIQFSYWFLFIYMFRLSYTNMHNLYPEMLLFYYCVYSIMAYPLIGSRVVSDNLKQ